MPDIRPFLDSVGVDSNVIRELGGLSASRVGELEAGARATLSDVQKLASGLGIPASFILSGRPPSKVDQKLEVAFRAPNRSAKEVVSGEVFASFVLCAAELLPKRQGSPEIASVYQIREESYEVAEELAADFRARFLNVDDRDPLYDLGARLMDIDELVVFVAPGVSFEGASVVSAGYGFIQVSSRFVGRMLFTLAHEVGHILVHHRPGSSAIVDLPAWLNGARTTSKKENFANAFASALLLPKSGVEHFISILKRELSLSRENIGDVEIIYLSRFFGVSFDVAALRLEALGWLPEGGARSLSEVLKKSWGSPERRAEALKLPARNEFRLPKLSLNLVSAIDVAIRKGDVSSGWVRDHFGSDWQSTFVGAGE